MMLKRILAFIGMVIAYIGIFLATDYIDNVVLQGIAVAICVQFICFMNSITSKL